jgi:hypothetical protein
MKEDFDVDNVKITERGWAGHFCCSDQCRFRRNTLIEYGGKKWIVSTVGNHRHPQTKELMTIGADRWYETMAFEACDKLGYIDADISKPLVIESECGLYAATEEELYKKYPLADNAANEMHENVVKEMIEKITK